MAALIASSSVDDTFANLSALHPDAFDALLGKRAPARAPWWIHKGKTVIADAAAARIHDLTQALAELADVRLASDCHGAALA